MKFLCSQQEMSRALSIVSRAVTARTTTQVMKGILLEAAEGTLKLSASDLDISIRVTIDVEVEEEGSAIVMAKLFSDIIRKLPHSEITIEGDEEYNIAILSMNSEFHVVGMSPDEFPEMNKEDPGDRYIEFDRKSFSDMIEKTYFAASIDEARGIITGVLLEIAPDSLHMVAIDGYRMAVNRTDQVTGMEGSFVIPAKLLGEVGKVLADVSGEERARLYINSRKAVFRFDRVQAEIKMMEGEFIKYQDILPKERKTTVEVDKALLLEGIERASLLSKAGRNNLIRMSISDNIMTISSASEEGTVREDIVIKKEGEDLIIGFNAQYMLDFLKKIEDEVIRMDFQSQITPCLITPLEGEKYSYIVLPVRIN